MLLLCNKAVICGSFDFPELFELVTLRNKKVCFKHFMRLTIQSANFINMHLYCTITFLPELDEM